MADASSWSFDQPFSSIDEGRAGALVYPTTADVESTLASIEAFQRLVRARLHAPRDYARLPGTERETLLKPGAQKVAKLLKCSDIYVVLSELLDWDRPLFAYTVKCQLVSMLDGKTIWSEGLGECNSREPRYRYRKAQRTCPACGAEAILKSKHEPGWFCWQKRDGCGANFNLNDPAITEQVVGRVENEDPAELVNTFLKMARKRALVDAALSAGDLSELFTQDMDEQFTGDDGSSVEEEPQQATRRDGRTRGPVIDGQPQRAPRQKEAVAVGAIKNGGSFMEHVNSRWAGHNQNEILGCLNAKKISDLRWDSKSVSGYIAALEGFWGAGDLSGTEAEEPAADEPPATQEEESADVGPTTSDGVEAEATA